MLYVLKKVDGTLLYYLLSGKEYSIGRKGTDIVLAEDTSISRTHATIKVGANSVVLIDKKSKYGTTVQDQKMEPEKEVHLKEKDVVHFGRFQHKFTFGRAGTIVTTGSGLNSTLKKQMKKCLEALQGRIVNLWTPQCTHLTVQEIVLTVKVLHALLDDKPIVTLDYWQKFLDNINSKLQPPDPAAFQPPFAEALLNTVTLNFNPERKQMFKNKTFVFYKEDTKSRMEGVITKTGGEAISWEKNPLTWQQVKPSKNKYIFITSDDETDLPKTLSEMHENVIKSGQRMIPIQEIAMAILLCDCEKDCNPNFNRLAQVFNQGEMSPLNNVVLAAETQSQQFPVAVKKEEIIPGTLEDDYDCTKPSITTLSGICTQPSQQSQQPSQNDTQPVISDVYSPASFSKCATTRRSESTKRFNRNEDEESKGPTKKAKLEDNLAIETKPSPSTKRKADVEVDTAPPKKMMVDNPFAKFFRRTPIARSKVVSDSSIVTKPIIASVTNEANSSKDRSSTLQTRSSSKNKENEEDKLEMTNPSNTTLVKWEFLPDTYRKISIGGWLSKANTTAPKLEVVDELKDFYDRFLNKIVTKVQTLTIVRKPTMDLTDGAPTASDARKVKNFKKFKKVAPLRPQVTIISTTAIGNNTTANVSIQQAVDRFFSKHS